MEHLAAAAEKSLEWILHGDEVVELVEVGLTQPQVDALSACAFLDDSDLRGLLREAVIQFVDARRTDPDVSEMLERLQRRRHGPVSALSEPVRGVLTGSTSLVRYGSVRRVDAARELSLRPWLDGRRPPSRVDLHGWQRVGGDGHPSMLTFNLRRRRPDGRNSDSHYAAVDIAAVYECAIELDHAQPIGGADDRKDIARVKPTFSHFDEEHIHCGDVIVNR